MKNEFIAYEQALALKELGFNEPCVGHYQIFKGDVINFDTISSEVCEKLCVKEDFIKAPLYQQAFKWFREEHDLYHIVHYFRHKKQTNEAFAAEVNVEKFSYHATYDEAEAEALKTLIELVKNK